MTKTDTGGSAFPTIEERFPDGVLNHEATYGMTLRDYFAGLAMQGVVASAVHDERINIQGAAEWSYALADAMIEYRTK